MTERRVCTCGHGETAHDYSTRTRLRTKCSVSLGPRGVRCPCLVFVLAA
jgi:hypothetical protein